jgi:hypothetical protein
MPDGAFCIDFGSAYTKVSLRRAKRTNSDLVNIPDEAEELSVCVPSAAVADYTAGQPKYTFGRAAAGRRGDGLIKPRTNWKKELFAAPLPGTSAVPPSTPIYRPRTRMEWLILSKEFRKLAEKYEVAEADLFSLRRLVVDAISLTIPQQYLPPPPDPGADVQRLAVEYFRWLRKTILDACGSLSPAIENPKDWPARITVPAFAPEHELEQHPGTARLVAALKEAGWPLYAERPVISEPYANVIGILTQGSNCTRAADMFKNGLLITVLRKPESYPTYRVVVVDVGAFTTDFAVLTLRTGGEMLLLSDIEFDTRTLSVPLGISNLDESVLSALHPEHSQYMREARAADWAKFRHDLYERRQPSFIAQASKDAIGTGPEMDRILDALATFESRLGDELNQFLSTIDDCKFKELILTGGGCALPANQKAIVTAAQKGRSPFRKVHLPTCKLPKTTLVTTKDQIVTALGAELQRGGTALGGTSAFFEMIT